MKFIKIKSVSQESFYIEHLTPAVGVLIFDMLNDSDVDDGYTLTIVEMTQDDFDKLPEFSDF